MTENQKNRDQADALRQKIHNQAVDVETTSDTLNLPPRSDSHKKKEGKTVVRVKYPVMQLLLVFSLCIPLTVGAYMIYQKKDGEKASSNGYESVTMDQNKPKEEPKEETKEEVAPTPVPPVKEEDKVEPPKLTQVSPEIIQHTVVAGDTLYSISVKYFGSRAGERAIREHNSLPSNTLSAGMGLEIPKDATIYK